MHCSRCGRELRDGIAVVASVVTAYHDRTPEGERLPEFQFALDPELMDAWNLMHVVCEEDINEGNA